MTPSASGADSASTRVSKRCVGPQCKRAPAQRFELLTRVDRFLPFLFLFVNSAQALECLNLVTRPLRESDEQFLGSVQEPCVQIILRQREQRLIALLRRQVGPRDNILMNSNGPIDLTAPPK